MNSIHSAVDSKRLSISHLQFARPALARCLFELKCRQIIRPQFVCHTPRTFNYASSRQLFERNAIPPPLTPLTPKALMYITPNVHHPISRRFTSDPHHIRHYPCNKVKFRKIVRLTTNAITAKKIPTLNWDQVANREKPILMNSRPFFLNG